MLLQSLMTRAAIALVICIPPVPGANATARDPVATASDPVGTPQIDPASCIAAAAARDDDKIIAACAALIDSEKTAVPERIKALIARAGAYERTGQAERASRLRPDAQA